jgi:hypothetical protein
VQTVSGSIAAAVKKHARFADTPMRGTLPVAMKTTECQECGEESDELTTVKDGGKRRKLCPDCLEVWEEQREIAGEAGRAMRDMMEYKG